MMSYWHHPRFSSYRTLAGVFSPDNWQLGMWQQLYDSPSQRGRDPERPRPLLRAVRASHPGRSETTRPAESARSRSARAVSRCRRSSRCKAPEAHSSSRALTRQDQTYGVGQFVLYDRPNPADPASRGSYNFQFTPDPTLYGPGTPSATVYQDAYTATCH